MNPEEALRSEMLKSMNESELESAIQQKIDEFHGFLTQEAALKLLAAEKGLLKKEVKKIADITEGAKNVSITGIIAGVSPLNKYPSGTRSRKITVEDGSGSAQLILWNKDADEAAGIKTGDEIEIANAYEKNNELRLGYSGYFKIGKRAGFTPLNELAEAGTAGEKNEMKKEKRIHVKSFISRISGKSGAAFVFFISDGTAELECELAANDERCSHLKEKREIAIESGLVIDGRIRIDEKTRLLLKREKVITGTLEEIKEIKGEKENAKDEKVEVVVSGKHVILSKGAAYKLLGVREVEGVQLSTIINLKKDTMLNRKVVIEV